MKTKKKKILSVLFAFYLLSAFLYVEYKQELTKKAIPPDLEGLVSIYPDGWTPVNSLVTDSSLSKSTQYDYDKISAKSYDSPQGERVNIVMTWSKNGIQKAGHIQQLCYSTQGFKISEIKNITLNVTNKKYIVTTFIAQKITGEREDVIYWRKTDGKLMNNITEKDYGDYRLQHRILKMKELLGRIFGDIPDNIMVRISSSGSKENKAHILFAEKYLEMLSKEQISLIMVN